MNEEYLEVNFEKYCKTCQHKELEEKFDPYSSFVLVEGVRYLQSRRNSEPNRY